METKELYREILNEHNLNPVHKKTMTHPSLVLNGVTPSCGDNITLSLQVDDDGTITDGSFTGSGCAISQASTSLMIDLIEGQSVEKAKHLIALFLGMIKGDIADDDALEELEDAAALKSIANLPARVKCAVLSWHTLDEVLPEGNA